MHNLWQTVFMFNSHTGTKNVPLIFISYQLLLMFHKFQSLLRWFLDCLSQKITCQHRLVSSAHLLLKLIVCNFREMSLVSFVCSDTVMAQGASSSSVRESQSGNGYKYNFFHGFNRFCLCNLISLSISQVSIYLSKWSAIVCVSVCVSGRMNAKTL